MEIQQMKITWDELTKEINAARANHQENHPAPQPWIVNGQTVYRCAKCKDTGWYNEHEKVVVDANGKPEAFYRFATRCECVRLQAAKKKLEQSGIAENMDFKNYDPRGLAILDKAKDTAIKYADAFELFEHERNNSILFCGQPGAGKTHLGTAICRQLIEKNGVKVVYMPYRNAITELKQTVTNEEEYSKAIKRYARAQALYIDDMCKGRTTEADINILYEIINYRYIHKLPVIISTEKKVTELTAWDEAIGSRIVEMCGENVVEFVGRELNYRLH